MDTIFNAAVILSVTVEFCKGVSTETTCYPRSTTDHEVTVRCNGLLYQPVCLICNINQTVTGVGWYIYETRITHDQFPLREGHAGGIDVNQCRSENYSLRLKNTSTSNHNSLYSCKHSGQIISQFELRLKVATRLYINSTKISGSKLLIQRKDQEDNLQCVLEGAAPPFTLTWLFNGMERVKKMFNYSEPKNPAELNLDVYGFETHSEITCASEGRYISNDNQTIRVVFVEVEDVLPRNATGNGFKDKWGFALSAAAAVSVFIIYFAVRGIKLHHTSQSENVESPSEAYSCIEDREADGENHTLVVCLDTKISTNGLHEYWIGTYSTGKTIQGKCFAKQLSDQGTLQQANEFKLLARKLLALKNFAAVNSVLSINIEKEPFSIVYEFMEYGSLRDLVISRYQHSPSGVGVERQMSVKHQVKELLTFAVNIAQAMEFIESQEFCHPFLSLKKVLLTSDCICKLYDIYPKDLAMTKVKDVLKKSNPPTAWMAPETVFLREYTLRCDAWSFSVLLWELFTFGDIPYAGSTKEEIEESVRYGNTLSQPPFCPESVYSIMALSWQRKPDMRPSFKVLYKTLKDQLRTV